MSNFGAPYKKNILCFQLFSNSLSSHASLLLGHLVVPLSQTQSITLPLPCLLLSCSQPSPPSLTIVFSFNTVTGTLYSLLQMVNTENTFSAFFSLSSFGYYKLAFCLHFSPLYFLVVFFLVQLCSWLQFFIFFFPHNNSQVFFQRMVLDGYLIQHIQYFLHRFVDCRQITWGVLIFKYIYHLQAQIISKDPKTNSIALFLAFSSASSVSIIFHSKYLFSGDLCQIICTC